MKDSMIRNEGSVPLLSTRKLGPKSLAFSLFSTLLILLIACGGPQVAVPTPESEPEPSPPPPSQWTSIDVGTPILKGDTANGDGSLAVSASGAGVWGTSDSFRYIYDELQGDGALTVRVDSISAAHEWTKAGVMVRESLDASARNAFLLLTDFNGVLFQRREVIRGITDDVLPDGTYMRDKVASAPWWLRLERRGDELVAWHSPDGLDWRQLGQLTLDLPDDALIGMAVTSRNPDAFAEAVFSNVSLGSISEGSPPPVENPSPPVESDPAPPVEVPAPSGPNPNPNPNPGAKNTVAYQIDRFSAIMNPERGFHSDVDVLTGAGMSSVRSRGHTLARSYVRLDDYRNQRLPESLLNQLRNGLQQARNNGIKIVLRFSYNFGYAPDARLDMVLTHISQIKPILNEYEDVLATLQAGFIGAWGEWHSSQNGLLNQDSKSAITSALLNAVPDTRMIQIRTPGLIRSVIGSPRTDVARFGTEDQARVGFKNDCFLSSSSDAGTYLETRDRTEAQTMTEYTVTGGETCEIEYPSPRSSCPTALAELAMYHYDYLNSSYYPGVISRWRNEGCFAEIDRRLGYRLAMVSGAATKETSAGGTLSIELELENSGFGKVYNPRPVDVVLRHQATGAEHSIRALGDARSVLPLAGQTRDIVLNVRLPSGLPTGTYDLYVRLPDASSNLASDVRYSLQFANIDSWQEQAGLNDLKLSTMVR